MHEKEYPLLRYQVLCVLFVLKNPTKEYRSSHTMVLRALLFIIHSFIHSSMDLQPFVGPWPLLLLRNLFYIGGRTPWTSDQLVARRLPNTQGNINTEQMHTQTSMFWVGFEPTIPAIELANKCTLINEIFASLSKCFWQKTHQSLNSESLHHSHFVET
jgi:hypothetical protein